MRKIRFNKKFFWQAFAGVSSLIFAVIFFFFGLKPELYEIRLLKGETPEPEMIQLWHIESFEGGSGSRAEYLKKLSRDFNKYNPNKFINIRVMTPEQLELNKEILPDLVSFSVGAGEFFRDKLIAMDLNFDVRQDLLDYGKYDGQTLAVPYMLGGYAIISRSDYLNQAQAENIFEQEFMLGKRKVFGVGMGMGSLINPAGAIARNGISSKGGYVDGTPYEVYEGFLKGNYVNLVGTQRDVYRIKNREDNGSFVSCEYRYLGGFSDMVQYMGILKEGVLAEQFIKFILNEKSQQALGGIGMFSVNKDIYAEGFMDSFERTLSEALTSVNIFLTKSEIEERKQQSLLQLGVSAYKP